VKPLILDLCGGTGSWSRPYAEAGYHVELVDLPNDVRLVRAPTQKVHGILAAPPCTMFCRMRMCRGTPTEDQFRDALSVVDACLRLVAISRPKWWALENPQGYLQRWLGKPQLKFNPCDYGDPWTKNTWIWGDFVPPLFNKIRPSGSLIKNHVAGRQVGIAKNFTERAQTPPGFARAFFEANP
jgi:hypothetical protein